MYWWLALAFTFAGVFCLTWNMWAGIHNPTRKTSTEERIGEAGWMACLLLAGGLLVLAIIGR